MKSLTKQTIFVVIAVVLIALIPLFLVSSPDADEEIFGGADDAAEDVIGEVAPDYEAWQEPLWEPPSGEIESLLFSVQVAIGSILIGFALGKLHERNQQKS